MKNQNLTNNDALLLAKAISVMGTKEIDDLDTALTLVEINDKLTNALKNNQEALNKMVVFSPDEKALDEKSRELKEKLQNGNSVEIEQEIAKHNADNKALIESINEKNKRLKEAEEELGKKPFKMELPKIDKTKLPKGLFLWQYGALKPILK